MWGMSIGAYPQTLIRFQHSAGTACETRKFENAKLTALSSPQVAKVVTLFCTARHVATTSPNFEIGEVRGS
jgi:hypothetical protein